MGSLCTYVLTSSGDRACVPTQQQNSNKSVLVPTFVFWGGKYCRMRLPRLHLLFFVWDAGKRSKSKVSQRERFLVQSETPMSPESNSNPLNFMNLGCHDTEGRRRRSWRRRRPGGRGCGHERVCSPENIGSRARGRPERGPFGFVRGGTVVSRGRGGREYGGNGLLGERGT